MGDAVRIGKRGKRVVRRASKQAVDYMRPSELDWAPISPKSHFPRNKETSITEALRVYFP